jgi:hypothetical protein
VVEEEVVHLPERALFGRRLGCLGGLRVHVDVGQRQVAPDIADVGEVAQQLVQDRLGLAAVGTLEVVLFDNGDGRVDGAADVVALGVDVTDARNSWLVWWSSVEIVAICV